MQTIDKNLIIAGIENIFAELNLFDLIIEDSWKQLFSFYNFYAVNFKANMFIKT